MSEKLENRLRNLTGQELVVTNQTKYTDHQIGSQLKENYIGDTNGEVVLFSGLNNGQLLLEPFRPATTFRHTLNQKGPSIYSGGKTFCTQFHPHQKEVFAVAIDDPVNEPQGIALIIARYDASKVSNSVELNKSVRIMAKLKPIHTKRGLDIFWHPYVSDLLYTAGNEEINLYALMEDESVAQSNAGNEPTHKLQKLCNYVSETPSFVADATLSHDGRYLMATFINKSSEQRGTFLKAFRADFEATQARRVEPVASIEISHGQMSKVCCLPSGRVVISRFMAGNRQIVLYNFNTNSNAFEEVHLLDMEGSSTLRLKASISQDVFYTIGKGDTSVHSFCVNSMNKMHHLGNISVKNSISGAMYIPEYLRDVNKFEMIKVLIFCLSPNFSTCSAQVYSFSLPRRGDPADVQCYDPLPYFEPSASISEWIALGSGGMQIKKIDPVKNATLLQTRSGTVSAAAVASNNSAVGAQDEFVDLTKLASIKKPTTSTTAAAATRNSPPQSAPAPKAAPINRPVAAAAAASSSSSPSVVDNKAEEVKSSAATISIPARSNANLQRIEQCEKRMKALEKRVEVLEASRKAKEEFIEELGL
ncbi:MAG: hypothetical protein MHMPM18_002274 [Marteilia pararefringens]